MRCHFHQAQETWNGPKAMTVSVMVRARVRVRGTGTARAMARATATATATATALNVESRPGAPGIAPRRTCAVSGRWRNARMRSTPGLLPL